ncbi:MAG: hypothetical protein IK149_03125 [Oscillospiraceae bacterium]|nr:hypothetical protein [Oscillospiraceae bacterium]
MKKIFALILALAMIFSLAACSKSAGGSEPTAAPTAEPTPEPTPKPTPEPSFLDRMTLGQQLLEEAASYRLELSLQITLSISDKLGDLDALISLTGVSEQIRDSLMAKTSMDLSLDLGDEREDLQIQVYTEGSDEGLRNYISYDGGQSWTVLTAEKAEEDLAGASAFGHFFDNADSFEPCGKETRDGRELILYRGKLPVDHALDSLQSAGLSDSLDTLFGGVSPEELFRDLDPLPVTIAFETESGHIAWYEADGTDLYNSLIDRFLGDDSEMSASVSGTAIRFELSAYNEIDAIEIPEEARAGHEPMVETVPEATPDAQVYHSDWMGLSFVIPADWTVLDRAEIGTQLGYGSSYAEKDLDEVLASHIPYVDLWAGSDAVTVQLMIEAVPVPFSDGQSADSPAAYMDHNAVSLPEMYRGLGIEVDSENRSVVTLCGRDYECFSFRATSPYAILTQTMMAAEKDGRFFTIYITCTGEDRTEEILSLFTADP